MAADASKPPQELTSILSQVQSLQSDKERLARELEEARASLDKLQVLCADPHARSTLFLAVFSFFCLCVTLRLCLSRRRREKEKR